MHKSYPRPWLLALAAALAFGTDIGNAHPVPGARQLRCEVARLESQLAQLPTLPDDATAPWNVRFQTELDLAEARCALALAEGRSMEVAAAALRRMATRYQQDDQSVGGRLAVDQIRLRLAKIGGSSERREAIFDQLRLECQRWKSELKRSKMLQERCGGFGYDTAGEQEALSVAKLRLAAAEHKNEQVVALLQEIVEGKNEAAERAKSLCDRDGIPVKYLAEAYRALDIARRRHHAAKQWFEMAR